MSKELTQRLQETAKKLQQARHALNLADNKRESHINKCVEEARLKATREAIELFQEDIREKREAVKELQALHDDLASQLAQSAHDAPYPLGTRMIETKTPSFSIRGKSVPTGRVGIVEPVTKDTIHPDNLGSYTRADIGSYIVRILKKDGTPSKNYVRFTKNYANKWDIWDWIKEEPDSASKHGKHTEAAG